MGNTTYDDYVNQLKKNKVTAQHELDNANLKSRTYMDNYLKNMGLNGSGAGLSAYNQLGANYNNNVASLNAQYNDAVNQYRQQYNQNALANAQSVLGNMSEEQRNSYLSGLAGDNGLNADTLGTINALSAGYNNRDKVAQERQDYEDEWRQKQWDYQVGRDQILDQRYNDDIAYKTERDKITDQRYNDDVAYKKAQAELAGKSETSKKYATLLDNYVENGNMTEDDITNLIGSWYNDGKIDETTYNDLNDYFNSMEYWSRDKDTYAKTVSEAISAIDKSNPYYNKLMSALGDVTSATNKTDYTKAKKTLEDLYTEYYNRNAYGLNGGGNSVMSNGIYVGSDLHPVINSPSDYINYMSKRANNSATGIGDVAPEASNWKKAVKEGEILNSTETSTGKSYIYHDGAWHYYNGKSSETNTTQTDTTTSNISKVPYISSAKNGDVLEAPENYIGKKRENFNQIDTSRLPNGYVFKTSRETLIYYNGNWYNAK